MPRFWLLSLGHYTTTVTRESFSVLLIKLKMVSSSPIFMVKLGHKILPGRVTIGSYDGKNPKFTAATQGERILLITLSPSMVSATKTGKTQEILTENVTFLNINQPIACLCAGPILSDSERSFLFVGTPSNVFGYDVENNKDLFYREVTDGVNVIGVGTLGGVESGDSSEKPIVITGGNCSLQGFDSEGNDCFWTVTGENVGAIGLLDFDGDGANEMLVGSDDYEIRLFKADQIVNETSETDAISCIAPLEGNIYAYALVNGTIGVYEKMQRLWRIKSKNYAVSICGYDFDGDGIAELVTAWSNGKLDIRNLRNGEVLFKDNFNAPLAGLCTADILGNGKIYLICCDTEGEMRIYGPSSSFDGKLSYISSNVEQEAIRELSMKKHHLMLELRNYEVGSQQANAKSPTPGATTIDRHKNVGTIPAKTQLQTAFAINMGSEEKGPHIEITLSTNNDTIIRAVLIFAEGIFQGECHVVHPKLDTVHSKLTVPLKPPKNVVVDLHIKAYVGYKDSRHYHVFELTRQLPRFAMFALCKEDQKLVIATNEISNYVKMPIQERPSRLAMWLNQNFLLAKEVEYKGAFEVSFVSLRNSDEVFMQVDGNGAVLIKTQNMDLAGDLVQSLCQFLNVADLETEVEFPEEVAQLGELIRSIDEYQETNDRLGADIADQSGIVKTLLIRAEDARLIGDIRAMRKWYTQLHEANRGLITQHQIRCTTNESVVESLKSVNQIIQKAARLRVGRPKANIITASRTAIKHQNLEALQRIIKFGATGSE